MARIELKESISDGDSAFNLKRFRMASLSLDGPIRSVDSSHTTRRSLEREAPNLGPVLIETSKTVDADAVRSVVGSTDPAMLKRHFGYANWHSEHENAINLTFKFNPLTEFGDLDKIGGYFDHYYQYSGTMLMVPNVKVSRNLYHEGRKVGVLPIIEAGDSRRYVSEVHGLLDYRNKKPIFVPLNLNLDIKGTEELADFFIKEGFTNVWVDQPSGLVYIGHGSVFVGPIFPSGTTFHGQNQISPLIGGYKEPAIDIGPDHRPYVVYLSNHQLRIITYDVLSVMVGAPPYMIKTDPVELNRASCYSPDIKVDRAIQRRDTSDVLNAENRFVHIVWFERTPVLTWKIGYAKFHPVDANVDEPTEPEIDYRQIQPPGYAAPWVAGELSLEISHNNNHAIIYGGDNLGYEIAGGGQTRLFCVFIDNNGMITSTNIQISDNNVNNEYVIHSSAGFTSNDELVCAWDKRTMVAPLNYHQTIWWRTFYWQ